MSEKMKNFLIDAGERAVSTVAEVALGMLTVGQAFMEVDWMNVLSVSLTAGIISILKTVLVTFNKSNE